jgi:hypothetical protein
MMDDGLMALPPSNGTAVGPEPAKNWQNLPFDTLLHAWQHEA